MSAGWIAEHTWILTATMFLVVASWETAAPLREARHATSKRWLVHLALYLITAVTVTAVYRTGSVELASRLEAPGWPYPLRFAHWILLSDLLAYAIHRAMHANAWLWRLHEIHHSDREVDVTTQFRFHPAEALLTRGAEVAGIVLFAPPALAVAVWGLMVVVSGALAHGDMQRPRMGWLGWLFITPGVHRRHHSLDEADQRHNFGVVFSVWDRVLGTLLAPQAGAAAPTGVREVDADHGVRLSYLLAGPVRPR